MPLHVFCMYQLFIEQKSLGLFCLGQFIDFVLYYDSVNSGMKIQSREITDKLGNAKSDMKIQSRKTIDQLGGDT